MRSYCLISHEADRRLVLLDPTMVIRLVTVQYWICHTRYPALSTRIFLPNLGTGHSPSPCQKIPRLWSCSLSPWHSWESRIYSLPLVLGMQAGSGSRYVLNMHVQAHLGDFANCFGCSLLQSSLLWASLLAGPLGDSLSNWPLPSNDLYLGTPLRIGRRSVRSMCNEETPSGPVS